MKHTVPHKSTVEEIFVAKSNRRFIYFGEHIPSIEVKNCIELGKLTALRFIEWIRDNPEGVIALPTGKTPEYFIRFLKHYKQNWQEPTVQQELKTFALNSPSFPKTTALKFVQIDEFYPIDPAHKNSFYRYIHTYYLPLLELNPKNVLMMNPALINNVEAFCTLYEKKIAQWGGIGFFLGGIGPDGHIAFNMRSSLHNSKTRLITLNYESATAAASSLGGMEYARNATAITIGLGTITQNKDVTIIIIAAGQGKAPVIAHAIEKEKNELYPATAFQTLPNARFYLTEGAASQLHARYLETIEQLPDIAYAPNIVDKIVTTMSQQRKKTIETITPEDLQSTAAGELLIKKNHKKIPAIIKQSANRFKKSIEHGLQLPNQQTVLHTAPHHDDVMLSYYPLAVLLLKNNSNYFAYATSGFNAVTNSYIKQMLDALNISFLQKHIDKIFTGTYQNLLLLFADSFKSNNKQAMQTAECLIFAHKLIHISNSRSVTDLHKHIQWLQTDYLSSIKPGERDSDTVQQLKGAMRESEVDRMWQIQNISQDNIFHLRSHFYTGDYFTPQPTFEYDVKPLITLLQTYKPDLITVAFDPEGTGPDTHYKVLQMVAQAVSIWKQSGHEPTIWGYRNVWHRFKPSESNLMVPISAEELKQLNTVFLACFATQKEAPFPSHQFDGPFSQLSVAIQKEQIQTMRTLLGDTYFDEHSDKRMRTASGLLFLKEMSTDEFLSHAQTLKEQIELLPD